MVRFEEKKFIIEVNVGVGNPVEDWLLLHQSLVDIIRCVSAERIVDETFYAAVDFLQELMPDCDTAKKMLE